MDINYTINNLYTYLPCGDSIVDVRGNGSLKSFLLESLQHSFMLLQYRIQDITNNSHAKSLFLLRCYGDE